MEPKTYQVWDSAESIETATTHEAVTPCQAAFFAANERKPKASAEFCAALGDDVTFVAVEPQMTYQVVETRTVRLSADNPVPA